jgi:hypothetical protein
MKNIAIPYVVIPLVWTPTMETKNIVLQHEFFFPSNGILFVPWIVGSCEIKGFE